MQLGINIETALNSSKLKIEQELELALIPGLAPCLFSSESSLKYSPGDLMRGQSYEDIYGPDRALVLKRKMGKAISKAKKGKYPAQLKKYNDAKKGKPDFKIGKSLEELYGPLMAEKIKSKISDAMTGIACPHETRLKIHNSFEEKRNSPGGLHRTFSRKWKQNLSNAVKRRYLTNPKSNENFFRNGRFAQRCLQVKRRAKGNLETDHKYFMQHPILKRKYLNVLDAILSQLKKDMREKGAVSAKTSKDWIQIINKQFRVKRLRLGISNSRIFTAQYMKVLGRYFDEFNYDQKNHLVYFGLNDTKRLKRA
jgi:hypothetical protein